MSIRHRTRGPIQQEKMRGGDRAPFVVERHECEDAYGLVKGKQTVTNGPPSDTAAPPHFTS